MQDKVNLAQQYNESKYTHLKAAQDTGSTTAIDVNARKSAERIQRTPYQLDGSSAHATACPSYQKLDQLAELKCTAKTAKW